MRTGLQRRAADFGLPFEGPDMLSNSRLAILAGEAARDAGRHHEYARLMFTAYFVHGENIGDLAVVLRVAERAGLDKAEVQAALAEERYADRLAANAAEARRWGVTGVPTFVVNESYRVVGAQPLQVFREVLSGVAG
jgi:predicted DsbA family dithiol-disulfide isomerase